MKFISRVIFYFFTNLVALAIAAQFVPGFHISWALQGMIMAAGILTAINLLIKPVLKLLFGPVIVLTLGVGTIAINAFLLWLLDYLSIDVSINGIQSLIYATLIVSLVNMVITFSGKRLFKGD